MYLPILLNHAATLLFIGFADQHTSYHTYLNSLTEP